MPKPYSHDLRSRALEACDAGERPGSFAQRFRISRASVYLWLQAISARNSAPRSSRSVFARRARRSTGRLAGSIT